MRVSVLAVLGMAASVAADHLKASLYLDSACTVASIPDEVAIYESPHGCSNVDPVPGARAFKSISFTCGVGGAVAKNAYTLKDCTTDAAHPVVTTQAVGVGACISAAVYGYPQYYTKSACVMGDMYPDPTASLLSVAYAKSDKKCAGDFPIFAVETTEDLDICTPISPTRSIYGSCFYTKDAGFNHYGYVVESYPNADCSEANGAVETILRSEPYGCHKATFSDLNVFVSCNVPRGSFHPTELCPDSDSLIDGCDSHAPPSPTPKPIKPKSPRKLRA